MKNVLLVADTPVAGTVVRFANALNASGRYVATPFVMRGYKNSSFDLPLGAMGSFENWPELLAQHVSCADAVVLHNVAAPGIIDIVQRWKRPSATVSYHLHSPPFEPPLYTYDIMARSGFDQLFCVAQGHERFAKSATPIANIISDMTLVPGVARRSAVFVGHLRTTAARWSRKVPDNFIKDLGGQLGRSGVQVYGIDRLFGAESVAHGMFTQALQGFDFVVDDVCSGLFHQLSLEGLKSGCIVFSAADEVSIESFCNAAACPPPPFDFVSDPMEVAERVRDYARKSVLLRERQKKNLEYAQAYLGQQRLGTIFVDKLAQTLNLSPASSSPAAVETKKPALALG